MNAPISTTVQREPNPLAWLSMNESELITTLRDSLYPGCTDASIRMVLSYCRARRLDPLQKPVHIVPMNVKKVGTRDQYEWRDIVMPGISLYRIQADRTGEHIGTSEPEFGPMTKYTLDGREYTVPEWCKVTVLRWRHGAPRAFVAVEYWIENYSIAGRDKTEPNAMWKKRARGQLAKCAEAQALRKGFPEAVGDQPTAEEMEGKFIEDSRTIDETPASESTQVPQPRSRKASVTPASEQIASPESGPREPRRRSAQTTTTASTTSTTTDTSTTREPGADDESGHDAASAEPVSENMMRVLRQKMEHAVLSEADLRKRFGFGYEGITKATFNAVIGWTDDPAGA